jgi:ribose transport system ATP-binding protein
MKMLAGVYQPDRGEIILDGKPITFSNARDSYAAGISIIYQELNNFPALDVAANIFIGREMALPGKLLDDRAMRRRAKQVLDHMKVEINLDTNVRNLPVAQQQLVEIAKALVYESRIIIMDEPNSALVDQETQALFEIIRQLREDGVTILYISHRLEEVFQIADRITVLRDGHYIGTWNRDAVDIPFIVAQMVGRQLDEHFPDQPAVNAGSEPALKVRNLRRKGTLEPVSFDLRPGEILGFAGLDGSGIRSLFHILFGLERADGGEIWYEGKRQRFASSLDAIQHHWGLVPASRRQHGLFMRWSLQENMGLVILWRILNRLRLIPNDQLRKTAQQYIERLNIATDSPEKKAMDLSGGNQQKVVIGKWLASNPRVLILDDPTRGIDVGAKAEIYQLISELAESGLALLFASSEINEVLELSHRILVMRDGRIVKAFEHGEATKENVLMYVSGNLAEASA